MVVLTTTTNACFRFDTLITKSLIGLRVDSLLVFKTSLASLRTVPLDRTPLSEPVVD